MSDARSDYDQLVHDYIAARAEYDAARARYERANDEYNAARVEYDAASKHYYDGNAHHLVYDHLDRAYNEHIAAQHAPADFDNDDGCPNDD